MNLQDNLLADQKPPTPPPQQLPNLVQTQNLQQPSVSLPDKEPAVDLPTAMNRNQVVDYSMTDNNSRLPYVVFIVAIILFACLGYWGVKSGLSSGKKSIEKSTTGIITDNNPAGTDSAPALTYNTFSDYDDVLNKSAKSGGTIDFSSLISVQFNSSTKETSAQDVGIPLGRMQYFANVTLTNKTSEKINYIEPEAFTLRTNTGVDYKSTMFVDFAKRTRMYDMKLEPNQSKKITILFEAPDNSETALVFQKKLTNPQPYRVYLVNAVFLIK